MVQNAPQLITYADRLSGNLAGLAELLDGRLAAAFGGVHILPFFVPIDGADAGFDPSDHATVDPRVGSWSTIGRIGADRDLMADLIVNHISAESRQFVDWLEKQGDSDFDGMFLTYDSVFPTGADEAELLRIYRPRPGLPFTLVPDRAGVPHLMWTTFTPNQIDLDVEHPAGWAYLMAILDRFERSSINLVRLDAVGYAIKRSGTSSFMIPETLDFIDRISSECRARGMTVLVEMHGHFRTQIELARKVDLVYDFGLPPLVLDALYRGTTAVLKQWLQIRPTNAVTVLDTHDGIGIVDVRDLLDPDSIDALVDGIHRRSGESSRKATGAAASNLDLYQVNCTFYDALGRDDERYLAARLIQLLVPGVPQIYYVGLLAGSNDLDLLERTGVGRDVNRHHFSSEERDCAFDRPVVRRLLELLELRASHPAFQGTFEVVDTADHELRVRWSNDSALVDATVDVAAGTWTITAT